MRYAIALAAAQLHRVRLWLRRYSSAQREAALTVMCIAVIFAAIEHFELGAVIFSQVEHKPDLKRDALILAGLTTSLGFAVFALRRWLDLTREIVVRKAAEARATLLASEDALTGLPNRRAFSSELTQCLARAARSGQAVSLVLLDLDRFKPVNDIYGHLAGDRLLQEITRRLQASVRGGEFVARLGGDEFALIIAHHAEHRSVPVAAAKRIADLIGAPVRLELADVQVGVSAGIASFPFDAQTAETLMQRADVALYRAKEQGRGRIMLFDAAMDAEIRQRAAIEADLRAAIAAGEVIPYYQPLVELRGGRIAGFEALARWHHPVQGLITPTAFIPIAEDSGLIGALGLSILRQGCRQARHWGADVLLSVNISPLQLADTLLADKILGVLSEEGLPPSRLEVELTENTLVNDLERARLTLNRLKYAGVSICLDDFGAGYSSLRHLSFLPFDRVKIDRAFVQGLDTAGDPLKIIRAIVGLCTSLGLTCTGEGAETAAHVALLRAAGCSIGQGWYFGAAVPACEAARLAADGRVPLTRLHATAADTSAAAVHGHAATG